MYITKGFTTLALASLSLWITGCAPQESVPTTTTQHEHAADGTHAEHADENNHGHSHTGDDALVWGRSDIQHAGFVIQLGHHSRTLHAGATVEPAVGITKDGQPVGDAQVFNSLLAS